MFSSIQKTIIVCSAIIGLTLVSSIIAYENRRPTMTIDELYKVCLTKKSSEANQIFNVHGALAAGYSPTEIIEYILFKFKDYPFDIVGARKEGYSDEAIIKYLDRTNTMDISNSIWECVAKRL